MPPPPSEGVRVHFGPQKRGSSRDGLEIVRTTLPVFWPLSTYVVAATISFSAYFRSITGQVADALEDVRVDPLRSGGCTTLTGNFVL
jgi:hypothetical protein